MIKDSLKKNLMPYNSFEIWWSSWLSWVFKTINALLIVKLFTPTRQGIYEFIQLFIVKMLYHRKAKNKSISFSYHIEFLFISSSFYLWDILFIFLQLFFIKTVSDNKEMTENEDWGNGEKFPFCQEHFACIAKIKDFFIFLIFFLFGD